MEHIKIQIYNALINDDTIKALVYNRIFPAFTPQTEPFPRISYYQVSGSGNVSDGKMNILNEIYSIDIFATKVSDTEKITSAVNNALNNINLCITLDNNIDLFEEDTKIYHKVLRYRIKSIN